MKNLLIALAVLIVCSSLAQADPAKRSDRGKRTGRAEMKEKFMEKYDKNKDGKIDDKEKEAIRAEWSARFAKHRDEFQTKMAGHIIVELDKNDDGKLNADEIPEEHRANFGDADKNDDGYVDKAELTKALEAAGEKMREQLEQRIEQHRKRRSE
jgi:Ca2+-binding EF-hand superfamily protein